jgi:hypothetical protein
MKEVVKATVEIDFSFSIAWILFGALYLLGIVFVWLIYRWFGSEEDGPTERFLTCVFWPFWAVYLLLLEAFDNE